MRPPAFGVPRAHGIELRGSFMRVDDAGMGSIQSPLCCPSDECLRHSRHTIDALVLREQAAQAQVIDHVLDLLDAVLDPIAALSQRIVAEVEDLEAGMDIFDKLCDLWRAAIIAQGDRVPCKARLSDVSSYNDHANGGASWFTSSSRRAIRARRYSSMVK